MKTVIRVLRKPDKYNFKKVFTFLLLEVWALFLMKRSSLMAAQE